MAKAKPLLAKPIYPYVKSTQRGGDLKTTLWERRNTQNVYALSATDTKLVDGAIARHNSRLATKGRVAFAIRDLQALITDKEAALHNAVKPLMLSLYRHSRSSYVGGETYLELYEDDIPGSYGYSETVWHAKKCWSGTNTHFIVTLQRSWLRQIHSNPGLATAGGKLTTHAEMIQPGVWRASWIEQGGGFELRAVSGEITLSGGSYCHKTIAGQVWQTNRNQGTAKKSVPKSGTNARGAALERTLRAGRFVDPAFLAPFRGLLVLQRRLAVEEALLAGEPVDDEQMVEFPDLLIKFGSA